MKKRKNKKYIIIAVIAVILVVYLVVIIGKIKAKRDLDREKTDMQASVTSILEENSKIQESIAHGEDESYLEEIARSEYSYVSPEERVYYDNDAS